VKSLGHKWNRDLRSGAALVAIAGWKMAGLSASILAITEMITTHENGRKSLPKWSRAVF